MTQPPPQRPPGPPTGIGGRQAGDSSGAQRNCYRSLDQQPLSEVSSDRLVIHKDVTGDHQGPGVPDVRSDVMKTPIMIEVTSKRRGD